MSSWSHLTDACVPTLTFEVIIKSCHSRSKSQEAIICMISLSVFQKFFGPLFLLPGSLQWGFNTKFWADSARCCQAGLSPVTRRTKIKSWKAKCALSLTRQIWKEVNALFYRRSNWTTVSSHSGEGLKTQVLKTSLSSTQCRGWANVKQI